MADDPKKPEEQEEAEATAEATPAPEATADAPEATEAVAEETPAADEKPAAKTKVRKKPAAKAKAKPEPKPEADAPVAEKPKPAPTRRKAGESAPVVRAHAKYVRTSARKARLVCDHIRGKDVIEARAILAFTPRAVARDWSKLLESAIANAENNHELIGDELRIASVSADEGPTLKRFRPRAMGRATKIRKRTSHLTITLTPKE